MTYARGTEVSPEKSRAEIESTLKRYGATGFGYFTETERGVIMFRAHDRIVKFIVPMPLAKEVARDKRGHLRNPAQQRNAVEAEKRRRWRALALVVKAKLEAVQTGIVTFEKEFLAHIVLPDGQTVGEWMQPQLALAYEQGSPPSPFLSIEGPKR